MTPKDPFLEGTFWDKFWRPIRSRALLRFLKNVSGGSGFPSGSVLEPPRYKGKV